MAHVILCILNTSVLSFLLNVTSYSEAISAHVIDGWIRGGGGGGGTTGRKCCILLQGDGGDARCFLTSIREILDGTMRPFVFIWWHCYILVIIDYQYYFICLVYASSYFVFISSGLWHRVPHQNVCTWKGYYVAMYICGSKFMYYSD